MRDFIYQIYNERFTLGGVSNIHIDKATALSNLSFEEKKVYDSYQFEKKSSEFLNSRYFAKEILTKIIPKQAKDLEIKKGIFGHPVVNPCLNNLKISISHSAEYCFVLCFSELTPMGVDFESINLKNLNGLLSQMTKKEQILIQRLPTKTEEIELATVYWTLKEALSKSLLTGMYTPFKVFEVAHIQPVSESAYIFESDFTNFPHYKGISWMVKNTVLSIVLPKKLDIEIDRFWILHELNKLVQ